MRCSGLSFSIASDQLTLTLETKKLVTPASPQGAKLDFAFSSSLSPIRCSHDLSSLKILIPQAQPVFFAG